MPFLDGRNGLGHFHYVHFYYAQVLYRRGGKIWDDYRNKLYPALLAKASSDGSWPGPYSKNYATAIGLIVLQLENEALPICKR